MKTLKMFKNMSLPFQIVAVFWSAALFFYVGTLVAETIKAVLP